MDNQSLESSRMSKKIDKLQVIGIIIAFLQLIVAAPQLKWAYEELTDNDVKRLHRTMENFQRTLSTLSIIEIPDSLQNETIRKAHRFQEQLLLYSNVISQSDLDFIYIEDDQQVRIWMEKFKRVFKIIQEINKIEKEISDWKPDSVFPAMLVNYINPITIRNDYSKLNDFYVVARPLINNAQLTEAEFKQKFPTKDAISIIKMVDQQSSLYINLLNQYLYLKINNLEFPVMNSKGEYSDSSGMIGL